MKRKMAEDGEDCRVSSVEKSPNDKLDYRLLTFANGFEALLVSSDDAKKIKSAASMAVEVGSFSDPQGKCEGCAHFLEHMIFLGSSKYPREDEFEQFLSKNGGDSNAWTEAGTTCYHFQVNKQGLGEALDMFAQMFAAPLLRPDSTDREINAIESEFRLTQRSDSTRVAQVFASFARPGHPYCSFGWGNLTSLAEATKKAGVDLNAELRAFYSLHYRAPRMRLCVFGVEPLDSLEAAVRTSFAGMPRAAPDEPVRGPQEALLEAAGPPFQEEKLPKIVRVRPVKDTHQLSMSWQLPPTHHLYRSKPQNYISHLVGHEGAGSLLALLKRRGLATSLTAGVDDDSFDTNSMCSIFSVDITLTAAGLGAWHDVVHTALLYLDMLRREGPQKWVYEEVAQVQEMGWRFLEETSPQSQVQALACRMLPVYAVEREHLLREPWMMPDWKPDVVAALLADMRPDRMMASVLSSAYGRAKAPEEEEGAREAGEGSGAGSQGDVKGDEAMPVDEEVGGDAEEGSGASDDGGDSDESGDDADGADGTDACDPSFSLATAGPPATEPHFGTEYWEASADELQRLLALWAAAPALGTCAAEGLTALRLPDRNVFLATDFTLRPPPADGAATPGTIALPEGGLQRRYASFPLLPSPLPCLPAVLRKAAAAGFRAWHLQDTQFNTPRSEIWLKLATDGVPLEPRSARAQVLHSLLGRALSDALNETSYLAEQASLHVWVSCQSYGLEVRVGGFHHKLPELLDAGLKEVFAFGDAPTWERRLTDAAFVARLEAQKEQLLRSYRNAYLRPGEHAADLRRLLLMPHRQAAPERAKALEAVDLRALAAFATDLIPKLKAEVLIVGNATEVDAEAVVGGLADSLREVPAGQPLEPLPRHPPLPTAAIPLRTPVLWVEASPDAANRNVAVEMYWQMEATTASRPRVVLDLLEAMMDEPFYTVLRTQQQIGYVASCSMRYTQGVLGLSVWLMSSKFAPSEICRRVEAFLPQFRQRVVDMPAEDVERHVVSLAGRKLEPHRTLMSLQEGAWGELQERQRVFQRHMVEAVELASVGREDVLELLDGCILHDAPKRRLAILTVIGGKAPADPAAELEALRKDYAGSTVVSTQSEWLSGATLYDNMV